MTDQTSSERYPLNREDMERFFSFLAPSEKEIFTGWFADREGDKPLAGYGVYFGPAFKIIEQTEILNSRTGATFHVCLNRTSDKGRKKENVQAVRVLCLDLDNSTEKDEILNLISQYKPGLIVESSPKKYHVYWRVYSSMPLEVWSDYQLGLAHKLGGDEQLSHAAKTIRVPGVPRLTKSGEMYVPRIVYMAENVETLDLSNLKGLFPWAVEEAAAAKTAAKERTKGIKKLNKGNKLAPSEISAIQASRNRALYEAVQHYTMSSIGKGTPIEIEAAVEFGKEFMAQIPQNGKPPMEELEIEKTVRSAFRQGIENIEHENEKKEKRSAESHKKIEETRGVVGFEYDYSDPELHRNRFTDTAILSRITQRFGESILRDNSTELVYAYDRSTNVWRRQPAGGSPGPVIYEYVDEVLNDVINDVKFVDEMGSNSKGEPDLEKLKRAEIKFKGTQMRESISRAVLKYKNLTPIEFGRFDSNLEELHVANGVLNMVTGELREPKPEDMLLFKTNVVWNPDAEYDEVLEFFEDVFSENDEPTKMVDFMLETIGYSLTGLISEKKIYCHYGEGSNGKSKILDILNALLGDYGVTLPSNDLVTKKNQLGKDQERIGTKIEGKRCAVIDDISTNANWSDDIVKAFSSKMLPARRLYGEATRFRNRCKCHVGLNRPPTPESPNFGLFRRMAIIPYRRTFKDDIRSSERIDSMIERQISGALRLVVERYQVFKERGEFLIPAEVEAACKEYEQENSPCADILTRMYRSPSLRDNCTPISVGTILESVNQALIESGHSKIDSMELGRNIKKIFGLAPQVCKDKDRHSFRAYRLSAVSKF